VLECVVNVSEGRRRDVITDLAAAAGPALLDVHADRDHNRSVFTLAGTPAVVAAGVRSLARATVARLDLGSHQGAHPRIGVLDVVPWVSLSGRPLDTGPPAAAIEARDAFAAWAGGELALPCFLYGPQRSLPEIRRGAWHSLAPDTGPHVPHPTAGAAAVGARPALVAYNLWLAGADLAEARRLAEAVRGPQVRALGLQVGDAVQVSCNLIAPQIVGPAAVFDAVATRSGVARAELVGLLPARVLASIPEHRWPELDLDPSRTIEARLEQAGLDWER
jgi:glutamate formiminotransferase / 5-formyltetrahydrofolate cyclo-ligase